MTLEEHAAAIEAAINTAAADGFHLDDHAGAPPARLDLNSVDDAGYSVDFVSIDLPRNPMW
jgi:hypothetical protein